MLRPGGKQFQGVQCATWVKWVVLESRTQCPPVVLLTSFTLELGLAARTW